MGEPQEFLSAEMGEAEFVGCLALSLFQQWFGVGIVNIVCK